MKKDVFPFTAIVGQEKLKKALILNVINPSIGGVLIKGDRGTGKTTAVRALTQILPMIEIVDSSPFNVSEKEYNEFELYKFHNKTKEDKIEIVKKPMKIVELPLGATEDRVLGSLNIEKGLKEGVKQLEPGILANAHNNILYMDEINLLDDNLVDILLDSAAFGVNTVERESVAIKHPSKFVLIGTMNPEEGELRKQLSDRIGLEISITGISEIKQRIQIMKHIQDFEKDPILFKEKFLKLQLNLKDKVEKAIAILDNVKIDDELIRLIAKISGNLKGHRKSIAILKTSKTIAAFEGSTKVSLDNLIEAVELVLGEYPNCIDDFFQNNSNSKENGLGDEKQQNESNNEENSDNDVGVSNDGKNDGEKDKDLSTGDKNNENSEDLENQTQTAANFESKGSENKGDELTIEYPKNQINIDEFSLEVLERDISKMLIMRGREKEKSYGMHVDSKNEKGKYVKTKFSNDYKDISIDATLRAASIHCKDSINVKKEDLRAKIRKHKAKASIVIVIDISGSMTSEKKINKIRGVLDKIIRNVNKNKDKLTVIGFKGRDSEIIIPNTKRPFSFLDNLKDFTVGGTTPMAAGLEKGYNVLKKEKAILSLYLSYFLMV
ncbi:MAG: ATP-binding protein [Methanobrevibacter sp.]|jgi:magnesium chelatase subunit D|nr:ATP-binding protein [Methanobrevibacter sp.]